jgi:hypothetical protein
MTLAGQRSCARNHGPRQAGGCGPAALATDDQRHARGWAENMAHTAFPLSLGVV